MTRCSLGFSKTSIMSDCRGTAHVTANPAAAIFPDQNDAFARRLSDGKRQLRTKPVIIRSEAAQHSPMVNVKLSTDPGRKAVNEIVGTCGLSPWNIWENKVKQTVPIPIIAANSGMLAAGVPWLSALE